MTIERQLYEKGWAKCLNCGTVRPEKGLKDGLCSDWVVCVVSGADVVAFPKGGGK